jgi:arylsulfatase A-like enzyme/Tfp pilus assembly protein PilF
MSLKSAFLLLSVFLLQHSFALSNPNVVLITIDTLRADHLGCYGYRENTTPNIDRMAASGMRFENAYSPAPITLTSHASILKGVYPNKHGFRDNAFFSPSSYLSVSEILKKQGYQTAAFVSGAPLSARFGLDRGFDYYDDEFPGRERRANETTARVMEWLKTAKQPYFLWVHYFDPHADYHPPEPFRKEHPRTPYDGEIAFVDSEVGKLWESIGDDALIVLTADHGESLGEHGESTHGVFLYNATIKVPLIFRGPGISPKVVKEAATLCDIAPSILQLIGIKDSYAFDGVPVLHSVTERFILAESFYAQRNFGYAPLFASIQKQKKFILAPQPEFYNLSADPNERLNQISKSDSKLWKEQAEKYVRSSAPPAKESSLSAEELEKLRSLGYVGASMPAGTVDPKSRITAIERFNQGMGFLYLGEYKQSEQRFRELLKTDPQNSLAFRFLGDSLSAQGNFAEAAQAYSHSVQVLPTPEVSVQLAKAYSRLQKDDQAEEVLKTTIKQFPEYFDATFELASLYESRQDWDAALKLLSGNSPEFANQRGILFLRKKEPQGAIMEFRKALESQQKAVYWNNLGIALQQSNQLTEAKDAFSKGLALNPDYTELEANLSFLLVQMQEWNTARVHLEHVTAANPKLWGARFALGLALENLNELQQAKAVYEKLLSDAPSDWPQRSKVESRLNQL